MMKILLMALVAIAFSASVHAGSCVRNARGKTVCADDGHAVGYNPRTGTAFKAEPNDNGVTSTQSSRGGEAKSVNGKGVYNGPQGTTCVKTANGNKCK
jgi:hypothetical protein